MIAASLVSGIIVGVCLTLGFQAHDSVWWASISLLPSSSTDRATLIAGFGGAAFGGVISWVLARQAANEGLRRDEIQRLNADKAAALRTIVKLQNITGGIFTLLMYINNQVKSARENGDCSTYIFDKIIPAAASHETIYFITDDLLLFTQEGKAEIINSLGLLAQRYSASLTAFQVYSNIRTDLADIAARYTSFGPIGAIHKTEFVGDDALTAKMKIHTMEQLIREIWTDLKEEHAHGVDLCRQVNDFYTSYFAPNGGFVALRIVEPTDAE